MYWPTDLTAQEPPRYAHSGVGPTSTSTGVVWATSDGDKNSLGKGRPRNEWGGNDRPVLGTQDDLNSRNIFRRFPLLTALMSKLHESSSQRFPEDSTYQFKTFEANKDMAEFDDDQFGGENRMSFDVGAKIDDVITALSIKSKRGRETLQRAMPPTNELCTMMRIRCY
ncbi:hypothetical protein ElyMa_004114300 [Elysia marginata]|uniref:Uncharacterized protein n=1 Tax=Elysia marginata TaxID=1093978 RepID=A0AAV4GCA7_9GAST|nr:hypothetical protein ElyMa_004114300 [Elysia marginata]